VVRPLLLTERTTGYRVPAAADAVGNYDKIFIDDFYEVAVMANSHGDMAVNIKAA